MRFPRSLLFAVALACASRSVVAADPPRAVDFFRDVKPILSDKCFACHGPDDTTRTANLRVDTREGVLAGGESGRPLLVAGSPEKSELYLRIASHDDLRMPPEANKNPLADDQIATLKRWIEQGAVYPAKSQWSFNSLADVPVPKIDGDVRNPIDAFVLDKLRENGFAPTGQANKETLVRRVAFRLTGLPPTVEEIDAFLADESPDAFAAMVDRYLRSPAYGERMTVEWLDLARFADTYGYQSDVTVDLSPWRDWVIKAFNDNLPYDQFIAWQIAGDLLPNATRDQVLATAFNRLHRQTNEGGSTEEEFRCEYVADRVHTFGTAFLGLTLECCRCHEHKYDPIRQADYYRLAAFFDNIDESGLYSHFTRATPTPTLFLYPDGVEAKHHASLAEVESVERKLKDARDQAIAAALATPDKLPAITAPAPSARFPLDAFEGAASPDAVDPNRKTSFSDAFETVDGHEGKAVKFSGDVEMTLRGVGEFDRTTPFSLAAWLKPGERQDRAVILHRSRAWTDSGSRGYELVLEKMRPSFALIHFYPGNAVHVRAKDELPLDRWSHVAVTYDGSSRAAGVKLFVDGQSVEVEVVRDNLYRDIVHRANWGDAEVGNVHLTVGGRFRDAGFKNGAVDDIQTFATDLTPAEVALVAGAKSEPSNDDRAIHFARRSHEACAKLEAESLARRREENELIAGVGEIMVMKELPWRRQTRILKRGAYDQPGEPVSPGTPEAIFPFDPSLPRNRLGLAKWLIDPKHPLTARVVVNRIWRQHFGRGLVVTQEDFGSQGQLPSHPELLDWLAKQFIDGGWDVKALHRLILGSATFQRASQTSPADRAADPDNRWLARGAKPRLPAELIRDNALAASGLLTRTIGGKSVKPYQPAGLWEEAGTGQSYAQDHGENLYRRSMYTFWRRTSPPPTMLAFDAGSREVCSAKRETTGTPLQALVLLNDPQFVEAARALAETTLVAAGDDPRRFVEIAFRTALGRRPSAAEADVLIRSLDEQRARFAKDPDGTKKYLTVGERPPKPEIDPARLAAATATCALLFNHDEFVSPR